MNLRRGYTTGSCGQAAAKASVMMLVTRKTVDGVSIETPSGIELYLPIIDPEIGNDYAKCGVIKDSGDDPDVTNGIKIFAIVRFSDRPGVTIKGGEGIGIVTKPGLAVPVGEYAINPSPRQMIQREVSAFLTEGQGAEVTLFVPGGQELAKRTFNPQLGILGGISIIGTTGIVEPRSIDAYKTSLSLQLDVLKAEGYRKATLVLGYVGERFCRAVLGLPDDSFIKIGDHVGFMLEQCAEKAFEEVLLIGHIGKLVKVAGGQYNTHYRFGDRRIELIAHYAGLHGASPGVLEAIRKEKTAEATIPLLNENGLSEVYHDLARAVVINLKKRVGGKLTLHCILLSLNGDLLGRYEE